MFWGDRLIVDSGVTGRRYTSALLPSGITTALESAARGKEIRTYSPRLTVLCSEWTADEAQILHSGSGPLRAPLWRLSLKAYLRFRGSGYGMAGKRQSLDILVACIFV